MFMSSSSTWGYLGAHEHTVRAAWLQASCWFVMFRWRLNSHIQETSAILGVFVTVVISEIH